MLFRKADSRDLERLIEIRQQFQRLFHHTDGGDALAESLRAYFLRHMADGGSVCGWRRKRAELCPARFSPVMRIFPRPKTLWEERGICTMSTPCQRSGEKDWRRRWSNGASSLPGTGALALSLWGATQEGAAVYRNLGFEFSDLEMELKL